jgi:flagellin-like protein
MIRNRKAVSPVIATVILVAVAITIAVAVAYWMGGISGQYTRFEKIELTSAYCDYDNATQFWTATIPNDYYWEVTLDFRNTGTTEASIINAFVNNKAVSGYGNETVGTMLYHMQSYKTDTSGTEIAWEYDDKVVVDPGQKEKIVLVIHEDGGLEYSFTSGTTIEVALHTGAGNTYMKMVTLS